MCDEVWGLIKGRETVYNRLFNEFNDAPKQSRETYIVIKYLIKIYLPLTGENLVGGFFIQEKKSIK